MKCPKCGEEIANDSNYCEYCGVKLQLKTPSIKVDISFIILLLFNLACLCIAYSVHWESFTVLGFDNFDGYNSYYNDHDVPSIYYQYTDIFISCIIGWLVSLIALLFRWKHGIKSKKS